MSLTWLKDKRATARLYAEDRKHLAGKARNYMNDYLDADPQRKEHVRKAIAIAAQRCREVAGISHYWSAIEERTQNNDARATIDASAVAIRIFSVSAIEAIVRLHSWSGNRAMQAPAPGAAAGFRDAPARPWRP